MADFIHKIIVKILSLPGPFIHTYGLFIIFLVSFFEALPLIGLLIPGQIFVILAGFLAKNDLLSLYWVIIVAAVASILGDTLGYFIGRKYGYKFVANYGKYFFFKLEYFNKIQDMVLKHTGKTLILGRFNSLTRAFGPFIAGASKISFWRFMMFNIIGGILWAVTFTMIGWIFGKSFEIASQYFGRIFAAMIVIIILMFLAYKFIKKNEHIVEKYSLYALVINIASIFVFVFLFMSMKRENFMIRFDLFMNDFVHNIWTPFNTHFMNFVSDIVSPLVLISLALLLFAFLLYRKRKVHAWILLLSLVGGLILEVLLKMQIDRLRPDSALISAFGSSFPSGHATMAAIFFSVVYYSFKDDIHNRSWRYSFLALNIGLFLIIGFSRIYLNVHWTTDVLAGFALGLFWITTLILIFKYFETFKESLPNLFKLSFLFDKEEEEKLKKPFRRISYKKISK